MESNSFLPPPNFSFDAKDWPSWKQRFSRYRLLSNLNAKEQEYKITALIYLMGERAEEIHSAFNLSADDAKNLDKVIEAFDNHFIGKRNVVYERALFGLRSQRPEETIEEFVTVLHRISEHCEYANLREELIRDRIVLGVKDRKLSEKLMLNENLTLAKAVEIARQWEAVMREQQDLNPSTSQVDTTRKVAKQKPKASGHGKDNGRSTFRQTDSAKETDEGKKFPTCFNCGTTKHHYRYRDKCPAKDKVCGKCGKKGHYTNLCRRKNNEVNAISSEETPAWEVSYVYAVREPTLGSRKSRWKSTVRVNGTAIHFKLDPGSDVTLIPFYLYKRYFSNVQLTPTDGQLMAAANQRLENAGTFVAKLRANTREMKETVYAVHHLEQPLLGVGACEDLQLVKRIDLVINGTTDVNPEREFPKLFEGLGLLEQPYHIKLKEGAKPFSIPVPRRVPLPLMPNAPEHFQKRMSAILRGVNGAICHMDDILIFAKRKEEHDETLREVLRRLKNSGITLNKEKCQFGVSNVTFLGHYIDEHGIKADEKKVKAIAEMKPPTDVHGVQRFMGMVNFLGRFVPNLAEITKPLNDLRKKDVIFIWGSPQKKAFEKVKDVLASDRVLASFDISKKTMVSADASSYGLGAVLKQEHEANEWRPVAFASRTLTKTEQGYAQIEKEALAITWACERFKDFVVGKTFLIETDHKPLVPIFTTKDLNDLTPRLQRYRMRMLQFSFHIFHTPGKDLITADALSRQPLPGHLPEDEELQEEVEHFVRSIVLHQSTTDDRLAKIALNQKLEPTLQNVAFYSKNGWPAKCQLSPLERSFYDVRDEIGEENGLLMRGLRVIIPSNMRKDVLNRIHAGHQGITKCRARAKDHVWWPGIGQEIQDMVKTCEKCIENQPLKHEPLIPNDFPERPWQKVGMDLFHYEGMDQSKLRGEEEQRKMAQKTAFDRRHAATKKAELIAGEKVWVKDLRAWGSVLEKASAPRSYIVETPVGTYRRNSLLLASSQQQVDPSETSPDSELPTETEETPGNELPAEELQQLPAIAPEIKQLSPSPGEVSREPGRKSGTSLARVSDLAAEAESDGLKIGISEVAEVFIDGLCPSLWEKAHLYQGEPWENLVTKLQWLEQREEDYREAQRSSADRNGQRLGDMGNKLAELEKKMEALEIENMALRRQRGSADSANSGGGRWPSHPAGRRDYGDNTEDNRKGAPFGNWQRRPAQQPPRQQRNPPPPRQERRDHNGEREENPGVNYKKQDVRRPPPKCYRCDSGSEANIVNIDNLKLCTEGLNKPTYLKGITGKSLRSLGSEVLEIGAMVNGKPIREVRTTFEYCHMGEIGLDGILGLPGFRALKLHLSYDGSIRSDYERKEDPTKSAFLSSLQTIEMSPQPPRIPLNKIHTGEDIFRAFSHCFCRDIRDMGNGSTITAPKLRMLTSKPVYRRQYPNPNRLVSKVKTLVDELEEVGIIEGSTSLWNSPLFPVAKTDGSVRITMDLRMINEATEFFPFPIPRVEDNLRAFAGAKVFSTLDLTSGFFQIHIPESDRDYFTFSLSWGRYHFTRLPQGAKNSAQVFQWAMNLVLGDLLFKCVRLYIDDVIVYSDSHEQHVADLAAVLERLSKFGLKAKYGKSYLFRDSVEYLGHVIDQNGIKPMWDNVAALRDLKRPHNIKAVRSLLGTVNYYRRFIPNAGEVLAPLSNLLRKGHRFAWGMVEQSAFETVKGILTSEPLLIHPTIGIPFILNTDASGIAVGACLQQEVNGTVRPIAYYSKRLTGPEIRYSTIENEAYAVVLSLQHFEHLLAGSRVEVHTDHKPITYNKGSDYKNARLSRWAEIIQDFNVTFIYVPGKENTVADFLSRFPCEDDSNLSQDRRVVASV
ncbi:K02A2.6-like, partial [Cordylochernes scorpioides]